ncbi:MAG TPA: exosortase/archaeosortase family protein, partial [Candidatus Bathyarchaeia archaeon]|nr:exosortase/archaeosortase family protein [Candidatus Bathyarchaeia archaeon]
YGLAVPVVSAFIFWRKREALKTAVGVHATVAGALVIACASTILIAGTAASELFTARLSLPIMLIGLVLLFAGMKFAREAAFPLLFLFMMIPLPYIVYYKLTFPLQLISARLASNLLGAIGMNVVRQGNILSLPNYSLDVVAACSGLRSVMTLATLALILCAFSRLSIARKTILAASSIPVAIGANVIRLAVTAIGAYAVSPAFADGILHEISGLIVFFSGFLMLLLVWGLLRWKQ